MPMSDGAATGLRFFGIRFCAAFAARMPAGVYGNDFFPTFGMDMSSSRRQAQEMKQGHGTNPVTPSEGERRLVQRSWAQATKSTVSAFAAVLASNVGV